MQTCSLLLVRCPHLYICTLLERVVHFPLLFTPTTSSFWVADDNRSISVIVESWVEVQSQVFCIMANFNLESEWIPDYAVNLQHSTNRFVLCWYHYFIDIWDKYTTICSFYLSASCGINPFTFSWSPALRLAFFNSSCWDSQKSGWVSLEMNGYC